MSQNWETADMPVFVSVEEKEWECVRLADVMGNVPVRELIDVLNADRAWVAEQAGRVYTRQVAEDVSLRVEVGASGAVNIHRTVAAQSVDSNLAAQERVRQRERLAETSQVCRQTVGALVGEALVRSAATVARQMGFDVVREQTHRLENAIQWEAELQVPVQV